MAAASLPFGTWAAAASQRRPRVARAIPRYERSRREWGLGSAAAMVSVGTNTDLKGLVHCHLPKLSRKHGMIPAHYVMPWKEDMKNRKFILKHADVVGIYAGATEDSLFLEHRERLCHGEERKRLREKIPQEMPIVDIPIHSHLSRYQKSVLAHAWRMKF